VLDWRAILSACSPQAFRQQAAGKLALQEGPHELRQEGEAWLKIPWKRRSSLIPGVDLPPPPLGHCLCSKTPKLPFPKAFFFLPLIAVILLPGLQPLWLGLDKPSGSHSLSTPSVRIASGGNLITRILIILLQFCRTLIWPLAVLYKANWEPQESSFFRQEFLSPTAQVRHVQPVSFITKSKDKMTHTLLTLRHERQGEIRDWPVEREELPEEAPTGHY
jgi:hypothetical protein